MALSLKIGAMYRATYGEVVTIRSRRLTFRGWRYRGDNGHEYSRAGVHCSPWTGKSYDDADHNLFGEVSP